MTKIELVLDDKELETTLNKLAGLAGLSLAESTTLLLIECKPIVDRVIKKLSKKKRVN